MAEDKIKKSATVGLPSREDAQSGLDLLSLALAQTSRDPQLMASVQLNIDRRMQAAREAEVEALKQAGLTQRTLLQETGAERRSIRASQTQLASTALAQEGASARATQADRTKRAIAALESRDRTQALAHKQGVDALEQARKLSEMVQPILSEAQSTYARLVTAGASKDNPFTQLIQANAASLTGKEKLNEQEQRTVAMAGALSSGGPIDSETALEIVTNFMGARMKGLPPEAQALGAQAFQAFAENFRLLDKQNLQPEEAAQVLIQSTPLIVGAEDVDQVTRFHLQNRLAAAWAVLENDDAARAAALEGVRDTILQLGAADINDEEDMQFALTQINMIIADGINFDDYAGLTKLLQDLKIQTPQAQGPLSRFLHLFSKEAGRERQAEWRARHGREPRE